MDVAVVDDRSGAYAARGARGTARVGAFVARGECRVNTVSPIDRLELTP